MFDLDNWQEIYGSIKKHKLRTLLTAFGVFWGILMLVLLLGAGKGLENGVLQMFSNAARNTIYVWPEITGRPFKGLASGRSIIFDNSDEAAIRSKIQELGYLVPNLNVGEKVNVAYGNKSIAFTLKGTHPDLLHIKNMHFTGGRFINRLDLDNQRKVVVIGSRLKEILFNHSDPVGKYINIKGIFFRVVGSFSTDESATQKEDAETLFMPVSTLQGTFGYEDHLSLFTLVPKAGIPAGTVETKVKELLVARHTIHPEDREAIGSFNAEKEFNKFTSLFMGINLFIWIVGAGTIIAGVIGVGNIMLIIVKERTREIGIRKALGATPISIISLIIMESLVITSVAGYAGLLAGMGIVESVRHILDKENIKSEFFKDPHIDMQVAFTAVLILVVTGVLAGLMPARKAAAINPIEALRAE